VSVLCHMLLNYLTDKRRKDMFCIVYKGTKLMELIIYNKNNFF
jgi:uncharacterized protein YcgL (UPF0745 family)